MRKYILRILLSLIILPLVAVATHAQHMFSNNHQWLNRSYLNPAATGSTNYLEVAVIARQQWIGMEGAPTTLYLNAQNLFAGISSGAGITLVNDYIGFYNTQGIKLSYSYHLQLAPTMALSFGLGGGLLTQGRDNTKINYLDPYDPEINPEHKRILRPDFDTGLELRYEGIRVGISAMHFNLNGHDDNDYALSRQINLYSSIRIDMDEYIAFMPVAILTSFNSRFYGEAGALVYIKSTRKEASMERLDRVVNDKYDRFWVGANISFKGNVNIMGGLFVTEQWRAGYSFGYNHDLAAVKTATTHEILVSWRLKTSTPRRYLCLEDCE